MSNAGEGGLWRAAILYPTNADTPPQPPAAAAATQVYGATDEWSGARTRSRFIEIAILTAAVVWPEFVSPPTRAAEATFEGVRITRLLEVAMAPAAALVLPRDPTPTPTSFGGIEEREVVRPKPQTDFTIQLFGTIVSTTPQGYDAVVPVLWAKRFPATLQVVEAWPRQGDLTSTPQGWPAVYPERWAEPFPAKLQQPQPDTWIGNVPTQFVGNAWVLAWDGPSRRRYPAAAQQFTPWDEQGDLVSTPQGWPIAWPERFARKFPAKAQVDTLDAWQGNVPAVFVGNAWVAAWDGPSRKPYPARLQQFEHAPQAAYSTVVVTFPEGWQVAAEPAPHRNGRDRSATEFVRVEAFTGQAWVVTPEPRNRPVAAPREAVVASLFVARFDGWWVEMPPVRARLRPGEAVTERVSPAAPTQAVPFDIWPPGTRRAKPSEGGEPKPPTVAVVIAPTGIAELWSSISHRFRVIRPQQRDFDWRMFRVAPRIASQPSLFGVSTNPTLLGVSTNPSLLGVSTSPRLIGVSTNPTLLGVSTQPSLKGEV